jgi:hypothetical protein
VIKPTTEMKPHTAPETEREGNAVRVTTFDFHHRVFGTPGARFLLKGHDKIPTFRVDMGDLDGLVDIDVLKKEFGLTATSHDGKLVDVAVAALRYVPDVKPGDTVPSELLTGEASWSVRPQHKRIAEQRLQVQLLSRVSGKEVLLTDPKEISNFLEQIENREKLRLAFREAAAALGFGENTEPVIKQLELLARELCYIEALRDRFTKIPLINDKITELGKSYGGDRNAKMELNRIQALLTTGIQEYTAMLAQIDAQTGEIISALKSIDRQVKYIREMRDQLHFLIMLWDPHINDLDKWHTRPTPETDKVMRNLYRFLAPRYTAGRSLLKSRMKPPGHDEAAPSKKDAGQRKAAPAGGRASTPAKAAGATTTSSQKNLKN